MKIDLRSDTVTLPTPEMLEAMLAAKVGDDVYKEDDTVNELEHYVAQLFGMDTALYFPTGTMANQAAIKLHTQPGDQLICDKWAHVYNYEGGGASFNSGVSCKLIDGNRGMVTAQQVKSAINAPDFYHSPLSSLVCIENTTNKGGGACYDINTLKEIKKVCTDNNLGYHLDGARLMNALVAKQQSAKEYGALFDTISICLSKGIGAPMGTVLVGSNKLMEQAIRIRKILGGGMRQVGYVAAAGLYGLKNHVTRLSIDHNHALEIANLLTTKSWVKHVEKTETNIVIFYLQEGVNEAKFVNDLALKNIRISSMGEGKWRIVTHLDYTPEHHQYFLEILNSYVI